ncbi:MAG: HD domain-containing protein [Acidobacteria bacterium]|nr:HD domain-containing protein [Acidobacteriota bacterium]
MKRKRPTKILYTLLAGMMVVAGVPLAINSWLLISYNRDLLSRELKLQQLQLCRSLASEVGTYMTGLGNQLLGIQRSLEATGKPLLDDSFVQDAENRRLLESLVQESDNTLFLQVVNRDGKGIQAGYPLTDPRLLALLDEAFQRVVGGQYSVISNPHYVEGIDQVVVILSRAVHVGDELVGVLSAVVSLEPVHRLVRETSGRGGNSVFIVDSRGRLFAHAESQLTKANPDLSRMELIRDMKSQTSTTMTYHRPDTGESMIGTVAVVEDVGWGVVAEAKEEYLNFPVRQMISQTLLWTLLAVVLAGGISILFSRQISVPIQRLAETTRSIAAGQWDERVQVKTRNELGMLGENFNLMAEHIEDYIEQLKQALRQNKELFMAAIKTLAAAIDAKDPYTRGHSERVMRYATHIAEQMELSEDEIEMVKLSALLHDVGKIGIEDAILKKPGALTQQEYEVMKQHPEKGANIMGQIPQLKEIIPGMRFHHEQLDGKGYPLGLRGHEIPLSARIIGVADTFDAMTTERPYQRPLTHEFALEKIKGMINVKFDEHVVGALIKAYKEGRIKEKVLV